uniref:Uncharacterized protein n=1 Tax=Anopheles farauti TaxID=69004 RepID=A0A182R064_9DIPT
MIVATVVSFFRSHAPCRKIMSSMQAFKEQTLKVRREIQLSSDSKSLLHALQESKRSLNKFINKPNHAACAAYLAKDLLDWLSLKEDHELEMGATKECITLLDDFLAVCHRAEKNTRQYFVTRLYNSIIALNSKPNKRRMMLLLARLMSRFPPVEEQAELFGRVIRVVLKTIQEAKSAAVSSESELIKEGIDLVIEMQRNSLVHAAGAAPNSDGVRQYAMTLFREVFDNGMAVLCRLYAISAKKADLLYETIIDTMRTTVRPNELELISLFSDAVSFLESILAYAGGEHSDYCRFAQFITIFEGIEREPYARCYCLLCSLLQLVRQDTLTKHQIERLNKQVRALLDGFSVPNPLVVRVAICLTCQLILHLYRLPQETILEISQESIDLFQTLMQFVRYCPKETVSELCRHCASSRRHLADKQLGIILHLHMVQAKTGITISVGKVFSVIKQKLTLLEELDCERKQSLIDHTMRQSVSCIKHVLTTMRATGNAQDENVSAIVQVLKLMITVQNRYRFDYLPDLQLVRLLENSYIDRDPGTGTDSCWPAVSVRMLKLLLTIREQPAANGEERHASTINAIVRTIMCYQINAPETDPIRTMTVVQLYENSSYDTHGFAFDCMPSRTEKFTILAEEMTLAAKYKTSNMLPVWEYLFEMAKIGEIHPNCLTFGMALHGISENDVNNLPEPMMDTIRDALATFRPATELERVKCCASRAILAYHTFSLNSRAAIQRLQQLPCKVEHFRSNGIDAVLLECQLERESQLHAQMEAIRVQYTELLTALASDSYRSLWVLPSIAQISSVMDNTARLLHLNYHPHRAVELQLVNLLLVAQRETERPLDQCAALGFLLEHHTLTDVALSSFRQIGGESFNSLELLAKRAARLLPPSDGSLDDIPDNRKFPLLNLYLSLAVYLAAREKHTQALRLIQRALSHLDKAADTKKTIGPLVQGRAAQIIFRLATEYGLPWPETVSPVAFLNRMLKCFNELQKMATEHTFAVSLATLDMTVAVLQHLIVRYDTGPLVEPQVEQLLRFALRRAASLRAIQLLLLYGQMCTDMEKLDRCKLALGYLSRLLMLTPIMFRSKEEDEIMSKELLRPDSQQTGHDKAIHSLQKSHSIGMEIVDDGRDAPKPTSLQALLQRRPLLSTGNETLYHEAVVGEYLMFHHSSNCDCRYCAYPQYKSFAFLTVSLATRLSVLQNGIPSERIEQCYRTLVEHWRGHMFSNFTSWAVPAYRTDLTVAVIQTLLQRAQFLVRQVRYDAAREAYGWALELIDPKVHDPAIEEDVRFEMQALEMLVERAANGCRPRQKQTRAMIQLRFKELLERDNKTNDETPEVMKLTTKMATMNVKSRTVAPPKTVDRVNELLRQAASRRHQLKTSGDGMLCTDGPDATSKRAYSASARKPKTVSIFVDSPPERHAARKEPTVPATVDRNIKTTTSKTVDIKDAKKSATKKGHQKATRTGKRELMAESLAPTTPTHKDGGSDSYRAALLKGTPMCTPPSRTVTTGIAATTGRKIRRLVVDDFPSLSESSDTDANTPQVAQRTRKQTDSPALNGSFRDVLVLGGPQGGSTKDDSVVIVLDDSNEVSHQSEEAIESSFDHSHAVSVDKRNGLALKCYSDRKRMLGSGCSGTQSATKRRTPLSLAATKTKLRFDDPSPEHVSGNSAADDDVALMKAPGLESKKKESKGSSSVRSRIETVHMPPLPKSPPSVSKGSVERVEPRVSSIASRTRLRRKLI